MTERDNAEELANAMIPFEENGEMIMTANWRPQDVHQYAYVNRRNMTLEEQSHGSIVIVTDLVQAPDGSLWRLHE